MSIFILAVGAGYPRPAPAVCHCRHPCCPLGFPSEIGLLFGLRYANG